MMKQALSLPEQVVPPRLNVLAAWLWGLVLLALPVTSFRYMPSVFGGSVIRPLAFYPLALLGLVLLWLVWRYRLRRFPANLTPLVAFILVALIATLFGALYTPLDLRGQSYLGQSLRAWASLGVGLSFYFAAAWMNRTEEQLRWSLKWLVAGLLLNAAWGGVQALALYTPIFEFSLIDRLQELFSLRGIHPTRLVGFAYEPSWLADTLLILLLPWLVAALLTGHRVTRYRWLDGSLLTAGAALLLLTFSRSGYAVAALALLLTVLFAGRRWLAAIWRWFLAPFQRSGITQNKATAYVSRFFISLGLLGLLVTAAFLAVQNRYFATFLSLDLSGSLYDNFVTLNAGPRLAYSVAGYQVYSHYPLTGVGLGGVGLYLYNYLPDWSLGGLVEIARRLSPDSLVISNPKNLYVLLLAETGLMGFWIFMAYYLSILGSIRRMLISNRGYLVYTGVAGLFIWLAVAFRNLTQDSLTFPVMWASLGIIAGMACDLETNASSKTTQE
jgi:hypothetical protein